MSETLFIHITGNIIKLAYKQGHRNDKVIKCFAKIANFHEFNCLLTDVFLTSC